MMHMMVDKKSGCKNVYPEFYDAAAAISQPRPFPSPVNDPEWLAATAEWFAKGKVVLEVGPGRGEFAEAAMKKGGPIKYYLVDMSQGMLDLVKKRTNFANKQMELAFLHADIDTDTLPDIPEASVDRIIMINAFQDVDPRAALGTFRRIISPSGKIRINVISRELRERDSGENENFDKATGNFYLTRSPSEGVAALGYLQKNNGEEIPYYRVLKSYYRSDLEEMFLKSGFEIISAQPIILNQDILAKSVAVQQSSSRMPLRNPRSIDVIAKPI
jgi:ubiquinone/menaquinone biosynthesis C-methylase UbiE